MLQIELPQCISILTWGGYCIFVFTFRHFKTAVNCSNDVQATNCKVEKEVTSMTYNTYNSFCEFETEHSVSGAQFVSTEAIIFVTAFGLTL